MSRSRATLRPPLALGRGQAGRSNALIQRNRLFRETGTHGSNK